MSAEGGTGGLAGLSVRRPYLAAVMNLLIVIAGVGALFGVEVRELPNVDRPIVMVRANYPGASPTTVDGEATALVEGAVARVQGVAEVRSSSEEGNFRVRVEFRPDRDLVDAANDVREAVSRVERRLPSGVEDLTVIKSDADAAPVMQIAVWGEAIAIDALTRRVEEEVTPALTAVDGVAEITVSGARQRVLRVAVKPDRLASYGLSIGDVSTLLGQAQFDVPVGSFSAEELEVLVRADATVIEPEAIERLLLKPNVRLGDVAEVYYSPATPESVARLDGRLVLSLGVVRQAGSNTVAISADIRRAVDRLRLRFRDLRFAVTSDDAVFIENAVSEVATSLALALAIVALVIWLFIGRWRAALAPALAMPISLIGVLAAIWLMGFSINLITLLALVLATGIVVDDAIVVLENIQRRRADGLGARAAAVIGARQVFFAVIATTVTLAAVFLPISFLPSAAGRLFTEFGYVLAITVTISSFVALTIVPMIASRLNDLGDAEGDGSRLGRALGGAYAALLRPMVAAPLVTLTAMGLAAAGALTLYPTLPQEITPKEDRGAVTLRLQGPDGVGLDHTDRQVAALERLFTPWIESGAVESLSSITGRYDLNRGEVVARLAPWAARDVGQAEIERALRPQIARLAGAQARVAGGNSLGLRGSSSTGLAMAISGPTYPQIAAAAYAFAERLEALDGLSDIRVQYQATQPQLSIRIDRARAADLNVSMTALSATLRALVDEHEVAELTVGDRATPIMLQSAAGAVRDPTDLLNLYVRSDDGRLTPLLQLVDFVEEGVAAELDRLGQRRAVEITADLSPEVTLGGAVAATRALAEEALDAQFGLLFFGEAATLEETRAGVMATYVIALVIVFLVLVGQFESLTSALIVMTTAPFGVCAAIYALYFTGGSINIYSQIGVLMLIGVMAKNGILLVEFADQLRDQGRSAAEAAFEAARARLRPIVMTLASTVFAGLPLILASGAGAEARQAIGWVVFGGLGLAALVTLFATPAAYALLAGLSRPRAASGAELDAELSAARR